jgi:hypothetical protein
LIIEIYEYKTSLMTGSLFLTGALREKVRGEFGVPHRIAVDPSENEYVAEQGNFRMQKFHCNGKFITTCGSEGSDGDQLSDPDSVAAY